MQTVSLGEFAWIVKPYFLREINICWYFTQNAKHFSKHYVSWKSLDKELIILTDLDRQWSHMAWGPLFSCCISYVVGNSLGLPYWGVT